ncbi:MAG: cation diffusion facilitator family transporter [Nitrososphaera sp.]
MVIEVVGAYWTGSLALLADAGHMLTDVAGLTLSLLAIWFASKPPTPANTYGYVRLEILAALANGVLLFSVAAFILYEAYQRAWSPPEVVAGPMLVIAIVGLGVNLLSMWLLRSGAGESLNLRGAYLEVLGDAITSLGVILAALIIQITGWLLADPIISAAIGLFILPRTWNLIRQAVQILMEGVPTHLALAEVGKAMTSVQGVKSIHDLHIWTISSGLDSLSAHVVVSSGVNRDEVLRKLQQLLQERFGIDHVTLQIVEELTEGIQVVGPYE